MTIVLISVITAFLYHKIAEHSKNSYIDCILFLLLSLSHFIWDYYFLPIDIVIAFSGVHLLSNFFEKVRSKE